MNCLKTAKGTKDYGPQQMAIKRNILNEIVKCFKRHGAEEIDTSVFEVGDILNIENNESMYCLNNCQDQRECLILRYDLTVPFVRYLAMNNIHHMKRYQIGKVYRKDTPSSGRFREFYQCDFDIAGNYGNFMGPDAECIRVIDEILTNLNIGEYLIRVNHKEILKGMFNWCGVPINKYRTIASSLDKLDKRSWGMVRSEMVNDKGLDSCVAFKIKNFIDLYKGVNIGEIDFCETGLTYRLALNSLQDFFKLCQIYGVATDKIKFDPSLARGHNYYTGIMFEVVSIQHPKIGSIAAGGRYDNFNKFSKNTNFKINCVGVSFGVERICLLMNHSISSRSTEIQVFVASAQKNIPIVEKMVLCKELWDADVKAEHSYKTNPNFINQLLYCENRGIPWMVVIGELELKKGIFTLRNVQTRKEFKICRENLVAEIKKRLTETK